MIVLPLREWNKKWFLWLNTTLFNELGIRLVRLSVTVSPATEKSRSTALLVHCALKHNVLDGFEQVSHAFPLHKAERSQVKRHTVGNCLAEFGFIVG